MAMRKFKNALANEDLEMAVPQITAFRTLAAVPAAPIMHMTAQV
jgi:hypothetical protein